MSAPTSSAPLVVNTRDGGCWTRRTVTEGGIALYALADVCRCPEFVMATLAELAEQGIVGSADVLPVPVVPEPRPRTMLDRARDALNARMTKDNLRLVLENVVTYAAALEAERHVTNEALDDAVQELRRRESGPALPWAHSMSDHDLHGFLDDLVSAAMGRWRSEPEVPDRTVLADIEKVCADWRTPGVGSRLDGSEFDGVTVRLAEREPEFHAWLHHENRLGHDLPETGGAS